MITQEIGVALECAALLAVITGNVAAWGWRACLAVAGMAAGGGAAFLAGGSWFAGAACLVLAAVIASGPWLPGMGRRWRK